MNRKQIKKNKQKKSCSRHITGKLMLNGFYSGLVSRPAVQINTEIGRNQ